MLRLIFHICINLGNNIHLGTIYISNNDNNEVENQDINWYAIVDIEMIYKVNSQLLSVFLAASCFHCFSA